MNQKNVGSLQVMIAGVLWATHGTIVSFLPAAVPTLALATIRLIIGGAGLGLILVLSGQKTLFNGNKNIPAKVTTIKELTIGEATLFKDLS